MAAPGRPELGAAGASMPPPLGLSRDEDHRYTAHYPPAPPLELPSVTTVLGVVSKPYLLAWYASEAAKWAVGNLAAVATMVDGVGVEATVKAISGRAAEVRDAAGDRGTMVHELAEARFGGLPTIAPAELAGYLEALDAFRRDTGFVAEAIEAMVANERYGYAGTLDVIGTPQRGSLAGLRLLVDVKTSSKVSADMALQLAAYRAAEYVGTPGSMTKGAVPRCDGAAILQLEGNGKYHLVPFDLEAADFEAFLSALGIYQWQRTRARIVKRPEAIA